MNDASPDIRKYDIALETAALLAQAGKPDVAVGIVEELFRMLGCEKETRTGVLGSQPGRAAEMEELLVKKYLEFKSEQKISTSQPRGYVGTFVKTLIVCSVITGFLVIGGLFITAKVSNQIVSARMAIAGADSSLSNLRLSRLYALASGDPKMFYRVGQVYEEGGDIHMALLYIGRARLFDPDNKAYKAKYDELERQLGRHARQSSLAN